MRTRARVSRPSKYHAKPCVVDGIRFASQKEAKRYGELKLLEKAGAIHLLTLQPEFELWSGAGKGYVQTPIGTYRADFSYCECPGGAGNCGWSLVTVEDVKGFKTPLYRWKKKHVEAQYGIAICEI